jgi:hypothetical protein
MSDYISVKGRIRLASQFYMLVKNFWGWSNGQMAGAWSLISTQSIWQE